MDSFDLWTKQNIIDIIFHFNQKNYELLRNFIKWYDIEDNYMYILSTRYFYSNECLKLLLSTINAFIDVKNNDISEEVVIDELEKEINIKKDLVIDELSNEINIIKKIDINELEKKNDSDEYVINDYYFRENIVKKEENVEEHIENDAEDDAENDAEDDAEDDAENDAEDDAEDDAENDAEDDLIINKFSNNEIILLLNILEEDTKKFSKHNYIIAKCKDEIFFYNNFYLGFTTGILVYCLLKLF
jgi:hypothetical protein